MKNYTNKISILLLFAATMLLAFCLNPTDGGDESACSNPSDNRISWQQVDIVIPECWTYISTSDDLVAKKEQGEENVIFQKTAPQDLATVLTSYPLSTGETLYAIPSNPLDEESIELANSVQVKSWSVAAQSCAAPDYDYAQSINYTWQKIDLSLPFCWGAEESHSLRGDPQLMLYKKEDGLYTRINFWSKDPLNENYVKVEDTSLGGVAAEKYRYQEVEGVTDQSYVFVLSTTPVWYLETNDPEENDVQLILNSLTFK